MIDWIKKHYDEPHSFKELSKYTGMSSSGFHVWYKSPTQFSREYKRMFGNSHRTDIKRLQVM